MSFFGVEPMSDGEGGAALRDAASARRAMVEVVRTARAIDVRPYERGGAADARRELGPRVSACLDQALALVASVVASLDSAEEAAPEPSIGFEDAPHTG